MNSSHNKSKALEITAVTVKCHLDGNDTFYTVTLPNTVDLLIPIKILPGVYGESSPLIAEVELGPRGASVIWPKLGVQFSLNALVLGNLDEPAPIAEVTTAADLGRRGGSKKSMAKTMAARANGARPKRPRAPVEAS